MINYDFMLNVFLLRLLSAFYPYNIILVPFSIYFCIIFRITIYGKSSSNWMMNFFGYISQLSTVFNDLAAV